MILEIVILIILIAISATMVYYRKDLKKNWKKILVVVTSGMILGGGYMLLDDIPVADSGWWVDTNWDYCKSITIDHTLVDATLTNFPILVHITGDTDLGSHAQDDGDDILFTLNGNNETKLNHEIEYYNNDSGTVAADIWVNITTLSGDTDTVIWMYYGNNTCDSQEDITGTWNSDYLTVYHMNDLTDSTIMDSTYTQNGTKKASNHPQQNDGVVGYCQYFDNTSNDNITLTGLTDTSQTYTMSCWMNTSDNYNSYLMDIQTGRMIFYSKIDDNPPTYYRELSLYDGASFYSFDEVTNDSWHYITYTVTSGTSECFLNGSSIGTDGWTARNIGGIITIGTRHAINVDKWYAHDGNIDELRISKTVRSDAWISTTYNTMEYAYDSGFYSIGIEEEYSGELNNAPSVSSPNPSDEETLVELLLSNFYNHFNITVSDSEGNTMNITWMTNKSGTWEEMGTNTSIGNGTYYCTNISWIDTNDTTYYWSVNCTDGNSWSNHTYSFTTSFGNYDFLIIAHEDYYDYDGTWDLQRLVDWHNENDTLNTYLVDLSDIISNSEYWVNGTWGDANNDNPYKRDDEQGVTDYNMFNDTQSIIRNYIRYANHELGVSYVLLVGGTTKIPTRYLMAYGLGGSGQHFYANMPTDIYYSCLNGTFNDDEDTYSAGTSGWGENTTLNGNGIDEIDWISEVSVGRFPCYDTTDLSNAVMKTISYMSLTGDEDYLYNITLSGYNCGWGDIGDGIYYTEQLAGSINTRYGRTTYGFDNDTYTYVFLTEDGGYPDGVLMNESNAIDTFNNGTHFWCHASHGGVSQWSGSSSFTTTSVSNLENTEYTFILAGLPCSPGDFDNSAALSIAFINDEHGAFGTIMNAETGLDDNFTDYTSYNSFFEREFVDAYFNESVTRTGDMFADAITDMLWSLGLDDDGRHLTRWTLLQKNFLGSPAVEMKFPSSAIESSVDTIVPYGQETFTTLINASATGDPDNVTLYYRYSNDNVSFGDYSSIEIDNVSHYNDTATDAQATWYHTVGSGENRVLVVCYGAENSPYTAATVTSMDYNGKPLTQADVVEGAYGFGFSASVWYLIDPDIGNHTVTVNNTANCARRTFSAISLFNVSQTEIPVTATEAEASVQNMDTDITTIADNSIIIALSLEGNNAITTTIGGSATQFFYHTSAGISMTVMGSYQLVPSTGTVTMYTNGSATGARRGHVLVAFEPSSSGGLNWTKWNDTDNPDTDSPWQWNFEYPMGTGYYEFYSIANKSGVPNETAPLTADAMCNYTFINHAPTITNPSPSNNSIYQPIQPICAITVADTDTDTMNVTFASNYTGSWVNYQTNSSVSDGTYRWSFTGASSYATTYYWKVYCNDALLNISRTYYFTTTPYHNDSNFWNDSFDNLEDYIFSSNNITRENGYFNTTSFEAIGGALNIALMVGNVGVPNADMDVAFYDNFTAMGHTVTYVATTEADMSSYDVVAISQSVTSSAVAWLKDDAIGILTFEGMNNDEFSLASAGDSTAGLALCNIVNNSHFITSEYSTGNLNLATSDGTAGYMNNIGGDVVNLITYTGAYDGYSKLLIVEKGGELVDASSAAERRAFFGGDYGSLFNDDAWNIVNRTLSWVANTTTSAYICNITSVNITKETDMSWDIFTSTVNNTDNSTFSILDIDGNVLLSSLDGDSNDISSISENTIRLFGEFNSSVSLDSWNVSWSDAETYYEETIRTDGIDYFVWLGDNCTLSGVGENISGFDEAGEYVSILGDDGAWDIYYGDTSGDDSNVYTFDVIRILLDDVGDDITVEMEENPDYSGSYENRTFTLTYVATQGVNYTGFSNGDGSTLGAEADKTDFLDVGEVISVWDDTNYKWIAHLQGTTINQNQAIGKWKVCYTRIYDTETWDQSGV